MTVRQINEFGMDTTTGQNEIGNAGDMYTMGAIVGNSVAPSLVLGSAAGTGSTVSIVGTNISGKITLTTALTVSSGTVLTMTLAQGLTFPGGCVITFSAGNSSFAAIGASLYVSSTSTTQAVLSVAVGLGISTTYIGYYSVSGW